jgi:hypothetical protein
VTGALKLALAAYKAQQTWRRLTPEQRQQVVAAARAAARRETVVGAAAGATPRPAEAPGTSGPAPAGAAGPVPTAASLAGLAAEIARSELTRQVASRATALVPVASRVAGALIRSRLRR